MSKETLPLYFLGGLLALLPALKTFDFLKYKKQKGGQKWGLRQWFYFNYTNRLFTREEKIRKIKERQNFYSLMLLLLVLTGMAMYPLI